MPALQWRPHDGGLFVRVRGSASSVAEALRRALQREMPGAAFVTVTPMANIVGATMRAWVVGATLFSAFGVLALVLAAVGLSERALRSGRRRDRQRHRSRGRAVDRSVAVRSVSA